MEEILGNTMLHRFSRVGTLHTHNDGRNTISLHHKKEKMADNIKAF